MNGFIRSYTESIRAAETAQHIGNEPYLLRTVKFDLTPLLNSI